MFRSPQRGEVQRIRPGLKFVTNGALLPDYPRLARFQTPCTRCRKIVPFDISAEPDIRSDAPGVGPGLQDLVGKLKGRQQKLLTGTTLSSAISAKTDKLGGLIDSARISVRVSSKLSGVLASRLPWRGGSHA